MIKTYPLYQKERNFFFSKIGRFLRRFTAERGVPRHFIPWSARHFVAPRTALVKAPPHVDLRLRCTRFRMISRFDYDDKADGENLEKISESAWKFRKSHSTCFPTRFQDRILRWYVLSFGNVLHDRNHFRQLFVLIQHFHKIQNGPHAPAEEILEEFLHLLRLTSRALKFLEKTLNRVQLIPLMKNPTVINIKPPLIHQWREKTPSVSCSINQSINQKIKPLVNQSIKRSIYYQPRHQSINQSTTVFNANLTWVRYSSLKLAVMAPRSAKRSKNCRSVWAKSALEPGNFTTNTRTSSGTWTQVTACPASQLVSFPKAIHNRLFSSVVKFPAWFSPFSSVRGDVDELDAGWSQGNFCDAPRGSASASTMSSLTESCRARFAMENGFIWEIKNKQKPKKIKKINKTMIKRECDRNIPQKNWKKKEQAGRFFSRFTHLFKPGCFIAVKNERSWWLFPLTSKLSANNAKQCEKLMRIAPHSTIFTTKTVVCCLIDWSYQSMRCNKQSMLHPLVTVGSKKFSGMFERGAKNDQWIIMKCSPRESLCFGKVWDEGVVTQRWSVVWTSGTNFASENAWLTLRTPWFENLIGLFSPCHLPGARREQWHHLHFCLLHYSSRCSFYLVAVISIFMHPPSVEIRGQALFLWIVLTFDGHYVVEV